jgi:hypothetical protein
LENLAPNREFSVEMSVALGKSCGECTLCCRVLVIDELDKDAGILCSNCTVSAGCKIYKKRPQVCRDYLCEWMTDRTMPPQLRPDRTGTILQEDPDSEEFQAVVDPKTPMAWRHPLVFKLLVAKAKEGKIVVAKSGVKTWRIFESGHVAPWT